MKTKQNQYIKLGLSVIVLWVLLVLLFCCMLECITNVAYAAKTFDVTKSDYYVDYSSGSLNVTDYYRDNSVTNGTVVNGLGNDTFSLTAGASVMKEDLNTLVFQFNLKDPLYENFDGLVTAFSVQFVVYSCAREGSTASEIFDVAIYSLGDKYNQDVLLFRRSAYGDEKVGVIDYYQGTETSSGLEAETFFNSAITLGRYECLMRGSTSKTARWSGSNTKSLKLALQTSSAYTRYFVRAKITLNCGGTKIYDNSALDSSVVSVADVLGSMKDRNELSVLSTDKQTEANKILNEESYEKVNIEYLERIGDTPFAKKVSAVVEVPVVNQNIKPADVASALGVPTFCVMQSVCDHFEYDSEREVYVAYYYKSVWLSAKTSDGNNKDYFLDCNLSFFDYYHQFVDDSVFDQDVYDWLLNDMKIKFPVLVDIDSQGMNIYGYFGYVVIPEGKSYNELFFKMFDGGQPHFQGTVQEFSKLGTLSVDQYTKLLDDYQYNWLEKIWYDIVGTVQGGEWNAYHHIFYVDSGVTEAFIANNGATDINNNLGHVANTTIEAVEDIANLLSDLFQKYEDVWKFVLGFIGVFLFLFLFFYLTTKIFKLKSAVNKYKTSVKDKEKAYMLASQIREKEKSDKNKAKIKKQKKYKRG